MASADEQQVGPARVLSFRDGAWAEVAVVDELVSAGSEDKFLQPFMNYINMALAVVCQIRT